MAVGGRAARWALLAVGLSACHGGEPRREVPAAVGPPTPPIGQVAPVGSPEALVITMNQLESRMSDVASGLWRDDSAAIERAALGIAGHAEISPDEVRRIQAGLGPRFGDFEAGDRGVHEAAVMLAEAARRRDLTAAAAHFEALQQGCIGCHRAVRAAVRPPAP